MRRALLPGLLAAAALAGPAAAAPPSPGVLVPGRTLGGLELGATKAEVERAWGRAYGICRGCARTTWYFNYFAFRPEGAGVEFRDGRAVALFTLWSPRGWRTPRGLSIGDPEWRIAAREGTLERMRCAGYHALTRSTRAATTAFYVAGDRLWAFGLLAPGERVCR